MFAGLGRDLVKPQNSARNNPFNSDFARVQMIQLHTSER